MALTFAVVAAAAAAFSTAPPRRLTVSVVPSQLGSVRVLPGRRNCVTRCTLAFPRGTVVRLVPLRRTGARFLGWQGGCAGRSACRFRLRRSLRVTARFAAAQEQPPSGSLASWNPHVACKAVKTTLPALLGAQVSALGGALEAGGAFQPHLRGDTQRHLPQPPCILGTEPTFVQIDGLVVGRDWGKSSDGDYTGTLADPGAPSITNAFMKAIHTEIDGTWVKAGVAPAHPPAAGTKIDVQGFVYWDPGHVGERFHNFSGWEIHPLSAWRLSSGTTNRAQALAAIAPAGAPSPHAQQEDGNDG
jgi:hypothetical protein